MRWCYPRHDVTLRIVRGLLWPFLKIKYGFKAEKFHMEKNKPYLVLANHRGFWDPFLVSFVYNRPIHFMATDNLFTNGLKTKLLVWFMAPIPKKKQGADIRAVRSAMQVARENGVVGIFPEGSRSYDGEPTSIDVGVAQLAKRMKADILCCGLYGVYASDPRWGVGGRMGNSLLRTERVITAAEAAEMSDEDLKTVIEQALDIEEAPTPRIARTTRLAEKLESFLYVCPKCGSVCQIYSKGNEFGCKACGMKGHMNPNLSLRFDDDSIPVANLAQWHRLQRKYGREFVATKGAEIFHDDDVEIALNDFKSGSRKVFGKGRISLSDDKITLKPFLGAPREVYIKDIQVVSPVNGNKLLISGEGFSYVLKGFPGFNPYKYAQIVYAMTGQPDREVK